MTRKFLGAFAAALLAVVFAPAAAKADTRLFKDSQVLVQDRISVEVVGAGPDVIFIPGLASSRETWRHTAERLRGRYRLHLVQVSGFAGEPARGNADGPVVVPTAEAIDRYIVQQKLSPATVVGHSLGGTMALYLAQQHPEHLRKVLLVDTLPLYALAMTRGQDVPAPVLQAMAERAKASLMSANADAYATSAKARMAGMVTAPQDKERVAGWTLASDRSVVARALAEDLQLDLRPGLAKTSVPITLLYPDYAPAGATAGSLDPVYTGAYAAAPRKTLKRIDGSLHFIMYDQPDAFAEALDAFLAPQAA